MSVCKSHESNWDTLLSKLNGVRVLCVAGAGRGPLIARALSALQRAARPGFVYAVEKNPNAIIA